MDPNVELRDLAIETVRALVGLALMDMEASLRHDSHSPVTVSNVYTFSLTYYVAEPEEAEMD